MKWFVGFFMKFYFIGSYNEIINLSENKKIKKIVK